KRDWSSDGCSSDLIAQRRRPGGFVARMRPDQLRLEIAEIEPFAEGLMGPLGFPGLLGGAASILLRDTCTHHRLPATSPASSLRQRRQSCRVAAPRGTG